MCVGGWRVRSLIRKLKIPNFIQKREKLNFALSNEQPPLSLTEIADIWFYSRQGVKWNWVSRCLVPDFTSHLLLQSTLSQVTGITVIKMTSAADCRQEGASLSVSMWLHYRVSVSALPRSGALTRLTLTEPHELTLTSAVTRRRGLGADTGVLPGVTQGPGHIVYTALS